MRWSPCAACVLSLFIAVVIAMSGSGCSESEMLLKRKDVQNLRVEVLEESSSLRLRVSGLAFHSSMAVKTHQIKTEGDTTNMLVVLTSGRPGLSGSFSIEVPVDQKTMELTFGEERDVIWRRPLERR